MVQKPVDLTLPTPVVMQDYVDRTEELLRELHGALMKPWFEGWDLKSGRLPERDPFSNAAAMREPIFYGGESAYNFQYRDLALLKYRADDVWLEENKGFLIQEACQIGESLGRLQTERQIEIIRSLMELPPDQWTVLPGFTFTAQDAAVASGIAIENVERFLESFSCGEAETNSSFSALNEFNITNSAPILKVGLGNYILLQHYSLVEAIYETPFFWMAADKAYAPIHFTNRGRFTEVFAAQRLRAIFGADRVLVNVDIYKGKDRFAEADALVIYGDRAIVIQAKSKRLTIGARKGNDLQLKDDFKKAVQDAYDQSLLCCQALTNDGFNFADQSGAEITIGNKPRIIFPICVVADHYPALAIQARQFLKTTVTESLQPPLVTDVFALDVFSELLDTPLQFLNYLALRARFGDKLLVSHELTTLGFHLKHNLWLDAKYDLVNLGDDFGAALDIAMLARREGIPGEKTPKGLLTRFDNLTIGRLLDEIEQAAAPQLTGVGLLLLQLESKTAKLFSSGIDRIVREAQRDGKAHDVSIAVDTGDSGITVHCNSLPDQVAHERLSVHCKARKYDAKANAWYGLLLSPATGKVRAALLHEEEWKIDAKMDEFMKAWPKKRPVALSQLASGHMKIRRNEPCSCGSGRKYKKCCLERL